MTSRLKTRIERLEGFQSRETPKSGDKLPFAVLRHSLMGRFRRRNRGDGPRSLRTCRRSKLGRGRGSWLPITLVNRTFECPVSAFQQSDPAAVTSLLFYGKHGSGVIAGMGWESGDAGEEIKCEALRPDAHNQAMRPLVRGDQSVFICGDGNDFRWFWHVHTIG